MDLSALIWRIGPGSIVHWVGIYSRLLAVSQKTSLKRHRRQRPVCSCVTLPPQLHCKWEVNEVWHLIGVQLCALWPGGTLGWSTVALGFWWNASSTSVSVREHKLFMMHKITPLQEKVTRTDKMGLTKTRPCSSQLRTLHNGASDKAASDASEWHYRMCSMLTQQPVALSLSEGFRCHPCEWGFHPCDVSYDVYESTDWHTTAMEGSSNFFYCYFDFSFIAYFKQLNIKD